MRYNVPFQLLFFSLLITISYSLRISSKLDFGDSSSTKLLQESSSQYKAPVEYRQFKKENQDLDKIGIICTSNNCNTTKLIKDSKSAIETDVIVHVQTNIAFEDTKKTNFSEEIPDIPVIVGTNSYNEDRSSNPENYPSIISTLIPPKSIFPNYMYGLDGLNPERSYLEDPNYRNINVNIKTLPPITDDQYIKSINFKPDNVNYNPSYNNHYFGENPPPQLVWFPKENVVNPVEFRNVQKSLSNPSVWETKFQPNHKHENSESCSCKNYQTGLQWYPRRRINQKENFGVQINDKLAPLN